MRKSDEKIWEACGKSKEEMSRKLKKVREKNGLTQQELADILQISWKQISKYETGKAMPTLPTLMAYSLYFHVSLDYLCAVDGSLPKEQRIKELEEILKRCGGDMVEYLLDITELTQTKYLSPKKRR